MRYKLLAMITSCVMLFLLVACGSSQASQQQPEETLYRLQRAFNLCNVEGVAECFEQGVQDLYHDAVKIGSFFVFDRKQKSDEEKMKTLIELGGSIFHLAGNALLEDGMPILLVNVNSQQELDTARVRCNVTFQYSFSETLSEDAFSVTTDVDIIYESKEWRIAKSLDYRYEPSPVNTEIGIPEENNTPVSQISAENETEEAVFEEDLYQAICDKTINQQDEIIIDHSSSESEVEYTVREILTKHPEIFWLESYQCSSQGSTVTISFNPLQNRDILGMQQELESAVETVLAQIPENSTDDEKILIVHDFLAEHTEYAEADADYLVHTVYGCLVNGKASCEGYSKAFQLIMQNLNIESGICSGATLDGIPHIWNYVLLNGNYYWIDITGDDPVSEKENHLRHTYCLIDNSMLNQSRIIDEDNLFVPDCNTLEQNYFVKKNRYLTSYDFDQIKGIIEQSADSRKIEILFASSKVYQQALHQLFDEDEIWTVPVLKENYQEAVYYTDDQMYALIIFL